MTITFNSYPDKNSLIQELRAVDISVPARSEGRKTSHTEIWTICRLLATLAETSNLTYPLSIEHRDRPDYLLGMSGVDVGIEITEAVSEQYAEYSALAGREFPDKFLQPGHFRFDQPRMSVDEMRELLKQDELTATPWVGNRAEREWASYISGVVESKLRKLSKPGFEVFPKNWLSVYDNLPMPHIHLGDAISLLCPLIEDCWSRQPSFDTLFIEHGPVIARIRKGDSTHFVLNDVWE